MSNDCLLMNTNFYVNEAENLFFTGRFAGTLNLPDTTIVSNGDYDIYFIKMDLNGQILFATDEDREGEAISWHLCEVLGLDPKVVKRIVFREITKPAIQKAITVPRNVDLNLVNAQQARRVLDRLVGFELSEILWRKVKNKLSAGRVQSVEIGRAHV